MKNTAALRASKHGAAARARRASQARGPSEWGVLPEACREAAGQRRGQLDGSSDRGWRGCLLMAGPEGYGRQHEAASRSGGRGLLCPPHVRACDGGCWGRLAHDKKVIMGPEWPLGAWGWGGGTCKHH